MEEQLEQPEKQNTPRPNPWDPEVLLRDATPTWRLLPPPQPRQVEEPTLRLVDVIRDESRDTPESDGAARVWPSYTAESYPANGVRREAGTTTRNPYAISEDEDVAGGYDPSHWDYRWRLDPVESSVRAWEQAPVERPVATEPAKTNWKAIVQEIAETAVLTLLIFVMMRALIQNYRIEGYSMEPNLFEHQYLIVNKVAYYFDEPARGDIIVFEFPNGDPNGPEKDYIKRIIGLPGDTVECQPNQILVNGEAIEEPYGPNPWNYYCSPVTLGEDEYFVLGDNRPRSSDSHSWGPLERKYIIGKAWLLYYPLQDLGWVPNYPLEAAEPEEPVAQVP
jgi:signal peptidase I